MTMSSIYGFRIKRQTQTPSLSKLQLLLNRQKCTCPGSRACFKPGKNFLYRCYNAKRAVHCKPNVTGARVCSERKRQRLVLHRCQTFIMVSQKGNLRVLIDVVSGLMSGFTDSCGSASHCACQTCLYRRHCVCGGIQGGVNCIVCRQRFHGSWTRQISCSAGCCGGCSQASKVMHRLTREGDL